MYTMLSYNGYDYCYYDYDYYFVFKITVMMAKYKKGHFGGEWMTMMMIRDSCLHLKLKLKKILTQVYMQRESDMVGVNIAIETEGVQIL